MRRSALHLLASALCAFLLAAPLSCSSAPPKPTEAELKAASDAAAKKAADDAAAAALAAKEAADKAAKEAAEKAAAALAAAVAALPAAPALPALPNYFEPVPAPAENPTTAEKVHLGWLLFFDPRLSKDGAMKCESCHHVAQNWTSGNAVDAKVGGKVNVRNAPTMANLGYHTQGFYWDGRKATLEAVSEAAWTGQLGADPVVVSAALNAVPTYRALFQRAFGAEASKATVTQALAAFFRANNVGDSAWDKFEAGDKKAVSKEVVKGEAAFGKASCTLCHVPPLYSDFSFHNTGRGFDAGAKAFADHGRMDATKEAADDGKFMTPSLRGVALTGPYFHDGQAKTLDEAIDFMAAGGVANPGLDGKLHAVKLSKGDKAAIKAFLASLTGTQVFAAPPALP
jgi:cytochrome c peroxidase